MLARQGALQLARDARSMLQRVPLATLPASRRATAPSAHGVDAVRDDEQRAARPPRAARDGRAQRALDGRVGCTVHVGGRLVQREDRRVRQQRPAAAGAMLRGAQARIWRLFVFTTGACLALAWPAQYSQGRGLAGYGQGGPYPGVGYGRPAWPAWRAMPLH